SVPLAPENAQKLHAKLGTLAEQWGEDWPAVYRQLRDAKVLDGAMGTLAYMTGDISQRPAALDLAQAVSVGGTTLEKLLPDTVKKSEIQEAVATEFSDLRRTFLFQGAESQAADFQQAMELQAMRYVAQGLDKETAADKAYGKILGENYTVIDT